MRDALYITQEAAVGFVESMNPGDRVVLIPFNSDIRAIPQLTDDRSALIQAIRSTQARGNTKLYDAVMFAMKHLSPEDGRKALVVFSDGEDTARTSSLDMALNAAARYGYPIYTIYAGSGPRAQDFKRVLRQLTEVNSGRMFLVDRERDLRAAFAEVAAELRSAFVAHYYTRVPADGRWHDIKISAANPDYRIHCRRGFYAANGDPGSRRAEQAASAAAAPEILSDHRRRSTAVRSEAARTALDEILAPPAPIRDVDERPMRASVAPPQRQTVAGPVFKVESRFVEVPVLVEVPGRENPPSLSEKDFRIYEDDSLRDIAFFSRDVQVRDLARLRETAMRKIQGAGARGLAASTAGEAGTLVLARYYLVLDDLMSDVASFQEAKRAAEKILRSYYTGLRPFSLHFASQAQAEVEQGEDLEHMIQRLKQASWRGSRELTSSGDIMSVYEAYLIERGDAQATALAELRYASNVHLSYRNALGEVLGEEVADPRSVEITVMNTMRTLLGENFSRASRTLDGLMAVVNAASLEPGNYPKTIIFLSVGLVPGRMSGRADVTTFMKKLVGMAKRNDIRLFTIDSAGLAVPEPLDIAADGSFLVRNPHLLSILYDHQRGWQGEKDSALNQLASDTGGRFLRNTNDLAAAAGAALDRTGQLYYLGYLSNQPVDGRFHRIRVSTSYPSARIHARDGYFAGRSNQPETLAATSLEGEDWEAVFRRAELAGKSGDWTQFAASLEQIVSRFPNHADIWYNLGVARLRLNDPARAVQALQKAFALSPDDTSTGLALSRALMADGYPDAAADTLKMMIRRRARDPNLLIQLGRIYEADGRPEEAFNAYRRVLDLMSGPPLDVYLLLARTSVDAGRKTEAGLFIQDYLARGGAPDRIDTWRRRLAGAVP
jgi:VWFA-related protein